MSQILDILTGPLAWLSFLLFLGGSVWRIVDIILKARKSDPFVVEYWGWKYALRSFAHWILPFGTMRWRTKPVLTVVTFVFHGLLFISPLFLLGHVAMFEQYLGVSWPTLPDAVSDAFAVVVIACCAYFLVRRLTAAEVRFVTRPQDWVILGVVSVTFVSGFLAYHQIGNYPVTLALHILSGEAFLVMIPFSSVVHMIYAVFMRGYIASEFQGVRMCKDW